MIAEPTPPEGEETPGWAYKCEFVIARHYILGVIAADEVEAERLGWCTLATAMDEGLIEGSSFIHSHVAKPVVKVALAAPGESAAPDGDEGP